MGKRILSFVVVCVLSLLMIQPVCAEVYMKDEAFGNKNTVFYVLGNPELSPIEYYNSSANRYEGAIPEMLRFLSKRTGIDFVYVNRDNVELPDYSEFHIVSSYVTDANNSYVADCVDLFSYEIDGKIANIGLAFTHKANPEDIGKIKKEISDMSEGEINGYLLYAGTQNPKWQSGWLNLWKIFCIILLVVVCFVMFKLKRMERKVTKNKLTDAETGIGNISYFEDCFHNMISDDIRNIYYILYVIIDSNYLSVYHSEISFSDAVKYIADELKQNEIDGEFSSRITENGFAFAFSSLERGFAIERVNKIVSKLNLFLEKEDENNRFYFRCAVYNLDVRDKNCGLILYNLRKNCNELNETEQQLMVCDRHMMNSEAEEKQLLERIENGFEQNEFKLYMQFIVNNKTGKIVSAEALSRWKLAGGEVVPPGKYIGVMETSGLISKLDYYMFERVCRQLHKWKDTEFDSYTLSCNITRITISEPDFVAKIKEIARKYVFDRKKLLIEITEDAIEENMEVAMNNILRSKELGFRIALDDMGSGYTSLINLCEYPIDVLKIDRDILLKADKINGKKLFVGVISLAHSLNLKVVCEGVETEEQNDLVLGTECDYIQGWYYSKPLPEDEATAFAKEYMKKYEA